MGTLSTRNPNSKSLPEKIIQKRFVGGRKKNRTNDLYFIGNKQRLLVVFMNFTLDFAICRPISSRAGSISKTNFFVDLV